MANIDLAQAKKSMLSAATLASNRLLDRFETTIHIEAKGRADFVTELDRECEEIIQSELANFDDGIIFIGEESTSFETSGNKVKIELPSTCFIVDPLDGTSNYMHSFNGYCVSIGLQIDNEIVFGVVLAPTLGQMFVAENAHGSFRYDLNGNNEMKLKTIDEGDDKILFATSVPFRNPEFIESHLELSNSLYKNFEDMRRAGSAALDLSWVAQGSFGIYLESFLKPWDCAAGAIILREAGGIISDWSGNETEWLTNGQICATGSARLHEKVLDLLK